MGFGRPVSHAVLGEPLRVSVPLRLEAGETLDADCVSAEVLFGDDKLSPSQVQVSLPSGTGRDASVQVRTTTPVNEPIVTYHLVVGCQAKINRQFVALADPPGLSLSRVAAPSIGEAPLSTTELRPRSGSALGPDAPRAPQSAALSSAQPGAVQSRRASTKAAAPSGVATSTQVARKVSDEGTGDTSRTSLSLAPKVAQPPAGRLVLDPVETDAAVQPDLRMSGSLSAPNSVDDATATPEVLERRAAAAALWQAMNTSPEDIARDRQKLLAQERMLAQLQARAAPVDSAASGASAGVATGARASEGPSWLVYILGVLALGGVGLCAALFVKLRRRQQAEAEWWQSQMQEPVAQADPMPAAEVAPVVPESRPVVQVPVAPVAPSSAELKPVMVAASAPTKPVVVAPLQTARPEPDEVMREVSVEELIDLEQQAEFFVVLGQDDAAVDLLESHVHSVTASPLPFLKLLEIYQRLGRHADYERVQATFNQRFNAHAPAWEADLQHGHELADYPGVIERLQALWPSPAKAMEVLEKSLTRPESEADTFELPAYRELLFLYAVARDLSEREGSERPRVDLLATEPGSPIGAAPFDLSAHDSEVEPLMATRPVKAIPDAQPTLSLDLQLDDLPGDEVSRSSYGDVTVSGKQAAANDQEVEHIDLPGLSDVEAAPRSAHKP